MRDLIQPATEIVVEAPASVASYSKTTVVNAKLMQKHLNATKESMIRDMASLKLSDDEVLHNFRTMAAAQVKADDLQGVINSTSAMSDAFTEREVEDMRDVKKQNNLTEHELAELYETNQSKINRVLNNQAR